MNKNQKIWLALSLIGVLILLFLNSQLEPEKITQISNITNESLNKEVKVQVKIISIRDFEEQKFQILKLQDETGNITGTANSNKALIINKSQEYIILGKISEYNKTLQLSINRISIFP